MHKEFSLILEKLNSLEATVSRMDTKFAVRFDNLESVVISTSEEVTRLIGDVTNIYKKLDSMDQKVARIDERLNNIDFRLNRVEYMYA